ncbi:MAG: YciI family protein [Alphaproteobacteria bacterium]
MFVILLKFSDNKATAGPFMAAHNDWLKRGFDDGVFLLSGGLQPQMGGAVIAHNASRAELERRVNDDPFVAESVVTAEILEIVAGRTDPRLAFLLD